MVLFTWSIYIINFILTLVAIVFFFRVLLRTSNELYRGILYCCIAVIVLGIKLIVEFLCWVPVFEDCSNILFWGAEITQMIIILLILVGSWHLQKFIRDADGELVVGRRKAEK